MYDASNPVLVVLCPMSTRIMALVVSEGYHVVITTNIHVNKMVGRLLKGNITMYASGEGGGVSIHGTFICGLTRTAIRSTTTPNTNYISLR